MKTKIILLIGAVAVVTLSFTFASDTEPISSKPETIAPITSTQPVGGLYFDVVE